MIHSYSFGLPSIILWGVLVLVANIILATMGGENLGEFLISEAFSRWGVMSLGDPLELVFDALIISFLVLLYDFLR